MELAALIIGSLAASWLALKIVYFILLTLEDVVEWFFRIRHKISHGSLKFTLKEAFDSGQYKLVEGVFDQNTEEVTAARKIESEQIDPTLANYHRRDQLVVYQ